ncbi:MAG: flagellar biosynthesis protein FlhB [Alphaproteobacteria bacterium]|nr:flagellar biosynthesis protein FlhB [Alphaproteobacteria bacterium]
MAEDQDEKTEEPTAKRLAEARERGEIIYSPEATTWLMLAAGALTLTTSGGAMAERIGHLALVLLESSHTFATDGPALQALLLEMGLRVGAAVGLTMLAMAGAGIAGRYLQDQPAFSSKRLEPKLERINPIEGFKRVFGAAALANFGKAVFKLVVVGAALVWALWPRDGVLENLVTLDLGAFWALFRERIGALIWACLIAFGALAIVDYVMTRQSYMKRMRMSRSEVKDELRQSEGDPQIKMKIRQIRLQRAQRRMIQAVPSATVVVTNPTHYAVALRYDGEETPAPICVAKGVDDIALKIREVAGEHDVPIIEDPPLARALYATAELDAPIPREHYEAVAKVIGVILRLANRRRPTRTGAPRSGLP